MKRASIAILAITAVVWTTGPTLADSDKNKWNGSRGVAYKQEFRDGNCKVERKVRRNGDVDEKVKCKGGGPGVVYYRPDIVIVDPVRSSGVFVPTSNRMLQCNRDLVGGLLGAAAGGALGAQVGRGDGRLAATAAGTVIGFLLGGEIGRTMDRVDQACAAQALERLSPNQVATWQGSNGAVYRVEPTTAFDDRAGRLCREFRRTAIIDGRPEELYGTACRQADGSWRVVS